MWSSRGQHQQGFVNIPTEGSLTLSNNAQYSDGGGNNSYTPSPDFQSESPLPPRQETDESSIRNGTDDNSSSLNADKIASIRAALSGAPDERIERIRHRYDVSFRWEGGNIQNEYVDMTPPDLLLKEANQNIKTFIDEKKNGDKAIHQLIRCTALAQLVYGTNHWRHAEASSNLAQGYLDLKGYTKQAQYHAEIARQIMLGGISKLESNNEKGNILRVLATTYCTLGRTLSIMKKYSEAERALLKAEKVCDERSKLSTVDILDCTQLDVKVTIALGKLCQQQKNLSLSQKCFEKAKEIVQKNYNDDNSPILISIYQDLGKTEQLKGDSCDHEKSIQYYLQAHNIASNIYAGHSIQCAKTGHALAMAYIALATTDAEASAESYLNECVRTYRVVRSPSHKDTLDIEDELCRLYVRTERQEEAVSLLTDIIELKKEGYGEISLSVAESYKLLAMIRLSQGNMENAIKHLKKCVKIQEMILGYGHKKTKASQETLDMIRQSSAKSGKLTPSSADQLKSRPLFTSIVGRSKTNY